jgi:hypothetical protein
MARVLRL